LPAVAHAAGFELTTPGARSVGRAGAVYAGADDALGLFTNPATILSTRSRVNASLALHLHMGESCLRRQEVIENADGTRSAGQRFPKVCDDGPMAFIPELSTTLRLGDKLALALGIYAPPGASAESKFGNPKTGTLNGESSEDPENRTPTRYLMLEQKQLQVFPTLGLAYELHPQLRLGAAFGWGLTEVDFTSAAFSRMRVLNAAFSLNDIANQIQGFDAFVPRVQAGVWGKPMASVPLELGASFVWTHDVDISDATLKVRGLSTDIVPPEYAAISEDPEIDDEIKDVRVRVPQLSQFALGARYADKLSTPADKVGDRLSNERFDIEAAAVITLGKHLDAVRVDVPAGSTVHIPSPPPGTIPPLDVPLPEQIVVQHQWQTQTSLRLGGDYNPIPGRLGLRAGVSYDSSGVTNGYQNIDFTPFMNVGLHVGATVRLFSRVDLSAAYAQFFFPDVKVSAADAQVRRVVNGETLPGDDAIVNAGTYKRSSSAVVLQVDAHF
jgi:long-subunit fatty acid transport protein